MLLSIDRVLQLLAEGKSAEKIAEMSDASVESVYSVIEEARNILMTHDKAKVKRKIIFKRKDSSAEKQEKTEKPENNDLNDNEIFNGAELSAVPLGSHLLIYTDGASSGNPGHAGIGIAIHDKEGRQVGKVSSYIGEETNNVAEYTALIRALKIAVYFKTKDLKIRTDSELAVKQIKGEYKVKNDKLQPLFDEVLRLKKEINSCRIEHIPREQNDKADFLAKKAVNDRGKK